MKGRTMFKTLFATVALGSALALAGCAAAPQTVETPAPVQSQQERPGGGGVSGLIAAADDGLLQVQSADEQTAVSYTAETTVSAQVDGALGDIAVGDCVVAITPSDADTATSVILNDPVDGECTGGFGGALAGGAVGPQFDGEAPEGAPTGFPTDGSAPSGAPTDFAVNGDIGTFASGQVAAIDGDTITVDSRAIGPDADSDQTTPTEVVVGADTAVTVTVAADASALVVGQCVAAQGEADDAGGLAATSLTVSAPGDEGCNRGLVGGAFPGGPGATEAG
jgi:hypothetical protein